MTKLPTQKKNNPPRKVSKQRNLHRSANDDDQDSPTPAAGKNVDKAPSSPSYSHSSAKSQEDAAMPEKDPEDAVKDPPEKSPPKDGTPVTKNDDSVSKPRSKNSVSKENKAVEKYGYSVVDRPKEVPTKSAEVIDELREEYDWYKLQDKEKELLGFRDMVNRHASSLTLT